MLFQRFGHFYSVFHQENEFPVINLRSRGETPLVNLITGIDNWKFIFLMKDKIKVSETLKKLWCSFFYIFYIKNHTNIGRGGH